MRPVQRHTQASASTRGSVYSVFLSLENGALPVKPEFIRGGMNFLSSHLEEISQETLDYSFSTNLGEKIHTHLNVPCLNARKQIHLCEEAEGFSSGV